MTGDDILFGEGGDDLIIGGWGNDWLSGGTGIDGILGDDGWMAISVNSTVGEPLYGVAGFAQKDLDLTITAQGKTHQAVINESGKLKMTAHLSPLWLSPDGEPLDEFFRPNHADDIIYGGLGGDFIHGGAGDDAISGAEALPEFYYAPATAWNILRAGEGIDERDRKSVV